MTPASPPTDLLSESMTNRPSLSVHVPWTMTYLFSDLLEAGLDWLINALSDSQFATQGLF